MTLIFNASPVIVLAKAGLIDQVAAMGSPSVIPEAVVAEVRAIDDENDPAQAWLANSPASVRVVKSPSPSPFLLAWDLGAGESAVISLAETMPGSVVVLDDLAARRCAVAHGLSVRGTLGLILMAKEKGAISSVSAAIEAVVAAGLFVAPKIRDEIRAKAGE